MLHYWKSNKQKLAYDTASGAVIALSSLEFKMIQAITPPLSPLCPSSLRYELAKYDSADVEEAYDRIYALSREGLLFAPERDGKTSLRIGGPYGLTAADGSAHEIASLLGEHTPDLIVSDEISSQAAEEIRMLLCRKA